MCEQRRPYADADSFVSGIQLVLVDEGRGNPIDSRGGPYQYPLKKQHTNKPVLSGHSKIDKTKYLNDKL